MLPGTILLGLAALMLYSGFTGRSPVDEIRKLFAGEPIFTADGIPLADQVRSSGGGERISGGGVRDPQPTEPDGASGGGSGGGARVK